LERNPTAFPRKAVKVSPLILKKARATVIARIGSATIMNVVRFGVKPQTKPKATTPMAKKAN
jgi:hypothetical protein